MWKLESYFSLKIPGFQTELNLTEKNGVPESS